MILGVVTALYLNMALSNPGYLAIKDADFNSNMELIETQFKTGDITNLENATENMTTQNNTTQNNTTQLTKKVRHHRKVSALTKDLSKNRRSRSPIKLRSPHKLSNNIPRFKGYAEFEDEACETVVTAMSHKGNLSPDSKKRKKIIGEMSISSSKAIKTTAMATNHQNTEQAKRLGVKFQSTFGNIKQIIKDDVVQKGIKVVDNSS